MIRAWIFGLAIAAICLGSRATAQTQESAIRRAYALRMEGKLDEAKKLLEAEAAKTPKEMAIWIELARLEFHRAGATRELDSAQSAIEKAIECNPDSSEAHRWASHIAAFQAVLQSGDQEKLVAQIKRAIAEGEIAVRLDPNDHAARRLLVSLYGNNPRELGGDPNQAEAHIKALEARSPIDGAMARCEFSHKSEPEKRRAIWEKLYTSHADAPRAAEQLALHFARLGDVDKMEKPLRKALSLAPKQGGILLETGRALALAAKPEPAEKLLKEYLEYDPPGPLAYRAWATMALGRLAQMRGDQETAQEYIRKAKTLDPYCWFTMTPPPAELFTAP